MELSKITQIVSGEIHVEIKEAELIVNKAVMGGEINDDNNAEKWLNERFLPNCVLIDEEGYSKMCVDALKILSSTAATDYGRSRQRDLGQLWADMTRGYLGELAFILFLEKNWGIKAELGHQPGIIGDFLPLDIHRITKPGEDPRPPKLNVSIKATKWNGIWLDIPGDQFDHSDIHAFVKVGTGRDHLFAFFKKLSVFKDKVLRRGEEVGALTPKESTELFDSLPTFKPVPAYVCGFVPRDKCYENASYSGQRGRLHYKITSWCGQRIPGDLDVIKQKKKISGNIKFEGIGDFSHDKGYLFNTGSLLWKKTDWDSFIKKI